MSNGYIPDGSGHGAAYGRCTETGRAFKRNGEVRKARTVKTVDEQMAALDEAERRAHGTMGRKILAALPAFGVFMGAWAKFRGWVNEAKAHGSPEAIEKKRQALLAQVDALDAKHEAAVSFLADQGDSIAQANGVFSKVGAGYLAFRKENGVAPDESEGLDIISEVVSREAIEAVEAATNPENDPFQAFRKNQAEAQDSQADDDDDVL